MQWLIVGIAALVLIGGAVGLAQFGTLSADEGGSTPTPEVVRLSDLRSAQVLANDLFELVLGETVSQPDLAGDGTVEGVRHHVRFAIRNLMESRTLQPHFWTLEGVAFDADGEQTEATFYLYPSGFTSPAGSGVSAGSRGGGNLVVSGPGVESSGLTLTYNEPNGPSGSVSWVVPYGR